MVYRMQLQTLWNYKFERMWEMQEEFFIRWNRQNLCDCVKEVEEVTSENYVICECAKKEADKRFREKEEEIRKIARSVRVLDVLEDYPQFFFSVLDSGFFD